MIFWYYDEVPDLKLQVEEEIIQIHRSIVANIPYFQEIISLSSDPLEIIPLPIPPNPHSNGLGGRGGRKTGLMVILNKLYHEANQRNMAVNSAIDVIEICHYLGLDIQYGYISSLAPLWKISESDRVMFLNRIGKFTSKNQFQRMFFEVAHGMNPFSDACGPYPEPDPESIYTMEFMTTYAKDLNITAIQNVIRCNPSDPTTLIGLLYWSLVHEKKDFLMLLGKLDLIDIFSSNPSESFYDIIEKSEYKDLFEPYYTYDIYSIPITSVISSENFDERLLSMKYVQVGPMKYEQMILYEGCSDWVIEISNTRFGRMVFFDVIDCNNEYNNIYLSVNNILYGRGGWYGSVSGGIIIRKIHRIEDSAGNTTVLPEKVISNSRGQLGSK